MRETTGDGRPSREGPSPRPLLLFLIGYRGSGKSSTARAVAALLGARVLDTDALIEEDCGQTIAEVFAARGEAAFRACESAVLARVIGEWREASVPLVVATGGGIVLDPANVARMRTRGRVVWLRAGVEVLRSRIARDPRSGASRPALRGSSSVDEVDELLCAREPLYRAAAHQVVDTDGLKVPEVARIIVESLHGD